MTLGTKAAKEGSSEPGALARERVKAHTYDRRKPSDEKIFAKKIAENLVLKDLRTNPSPIDLRMGQA